MTNSSTDLICINFVYTMLLRVRGIDTLGVITSGKIHYWKKGGTLNVDECTVSKTLTRHSWIHYTDCYSFLAFDFCRFCVFIRGFFIPPQRLVTSDFEGFSIPDFIHYIYFPIYVVYLCPINCGKKSHLFGKVTYVTAIIWTYIPYMIHQSYHHTPRTYKDSN